MEMMLGTSSSIPVQPSPEGLIRQRFETVSTPHMAAVTTSDWRQMLPVLSGSKVVLRELRASDAASLLKMLTTEEVTRFISPPPTTVEGFQEFIAWTHRKRSEGRYACFAVVPEGMDTAIGIFQLRALDPEFGTAEWGFALGMPFWGTGLFNQGAALTLAFAFDRLGVHRLEARAVPGNGRGTGALRKMGAVPESVLRQSFLKDGRYHDQILWSLLAADWHQANGLWEPSRRGFQESLDTPQDHVGRQVEATLACGASCGVH
jgi:RimJ/RimL family protein N-acetyltransferase